MSGNRLLQAIASSLLRLTGEVILVVKPQKKVIHSPEEHAQIVKSRSDPRCRRRRCCHAKGIWEKWVNA